MPPTHPVVELQDTDRGGFGGEEPDDLRGLQQLQLSSKADCGERCVWTGRPEDGRESQLSYSWQIKSFDRVWLTLGGNS